MTQSIKKTLALFLALSILGPAALSQNRPYRDQQSPRYGARNSRLTGTWQLNVNRSDNARAVLERNTRTLDVNDRQRIQENMLRRLDAPRTIAIDRRGQAVTMASTQAAQVSFEANGIETTETTRNGRERRTRATLYGDQLTVRSVGDRGSDYEVIFDVIEGGRSMRVTRSLYTERLDQPVVVRSVYERSSDIAQLDFDRNLPDISPNSPPPLRGTPPVRGNFFVPNGTQLTGRLNQLLDTKQSREGDRFTLNVRDSGPYNGAVIEGVVARTDRSGRVSGRADMTLDFERIRMRDGRSFNFAGTIDSVRLPNGESVRVNQEGNVREDDSQTSRTVTRSAIGGAIGAVIGAIAGGGKGAAIGAAVGAGAGAGSIFIEGRDDLELPAGTEITIRASSPAMMRQR
jgi:hypothetical protein